MARLVLSGIAALLIQPLALACETNKAQALAAGSRFVSVQSELSTLQVLFEEAKAEFDRLQAEAGDKQGDPDWADEIEYYDYELQTYQEEWEIGQRLLETANQALNAALASHESACGANAQTGAILAELGLTKTR